eukprot:scaffold40657_cov54-Phaeocystis_antarctica.AAC.3
MLRLEIGAVLRCIWQRCRGSNDHTEHNRLCHSPTSSASIRQLPHHHSHCPTSLQPPRARQPVARVARSTRTRAKGARAKRARAKGARAKGARAKRARAKGARAKGARARRARAQPWLSRGSSTSPSSTSSTSTSSTSTSPSSASSSSTSSSSSSDAVNPNVTTARQAMTTARQARAERERNTKMVGMTEPQRVRYLKSLRQAAEERHGRGSGQGRRRPPQAWPYGTCHGQGWQRRG